MARPPRTTRRRRAVAVVTALATSAGAAALLAPATSSASSHREAPYTSTDPEVDGTDVYAFVSPDDPDTVTLIGSFWPFEEPDGGPNFYKFADDGSVYDFNVDNDGDSVADQTYRFTFSSSFRTGDTFLYNTGVVDSVDDPDLNFRQTYDLTLLDGASGDSVTLVEDAPVAPSNVGPASMPDYEAVRDSAITGLTGGGEVFAGQSDDAFFLDLRVFDLLYGGDFSEVGNDTLDGYNAQTIALKLPKDALALNGNSADNPVIGLWSTTGRPTTRVLAATDAEGPAIEPGNVETTQVSRLGNPLVNEVVIPVKDKDQFNASQPVDDAASFLEYVQDPEVPRLIEAIYEVPAPDSDPSTEQTERTDLVEVFLTGVCAVEGCPDTVGDANLNSQLLNADVDPTAFVPSEQLRLNMSVPPTASPNRLGVIGGDLAGYPNGRRLTDDVIDIALQVVEGELLGSANDLGDAVDANDVAFSNAFPYVALPHNVAVNRS